MREPKNQMLGTMVPPLCSYVLKKYFAILPPGSIGIITFDVTIRFAPLPVNLIKVANGYEHIQRQESHLYKTSQVDPKGVLLHLELK